MMMYVTTSMITKNAKRIVPSKHDPSRRIRLLSQQHPLSTENHCAAVRRTTRTLSIRYYSTEGNNNIYRTTTRLNNDNNDDHNHRENQNTAATSQTTIPNETTSTATTAAAMITTKQATESLFSALSKIQQGRPITQRNIVPPPPPTTTTTTTTTPRTTILPRPTPTTILPRPTPTTILRRPTPSHSTSNLFKNINNNNDKNSNTTAFGSLSKLFPSSSRISSPLSNNNHNVHINNNNHYNNGNYNNTSSRNNNSGLKRPLLRPPSTDNTPSAGNTPLRTEASLFDVFQVPEPPKLQVTTDEDGSFTKRSPNAYPIESIKQYYEILEPIIMSEKFLKKHTNTPISQQQAQPVFEWLKAEEPMVVSDLPTFQAAIKGQIPPDQKYEARKQLFKELTDQHERFCSHMKFCEKQARLASQGLFVSISMCARHGKGLPVDVIWEKLKEGAYYQKECLQNLLYVSATFSTGSARSRRKRRSKYGHLAGIASILDVLDVHETTNADNSEKVDSDADDDTDLVDITDEIAIFHDLLYEPSEQSINVRVKLLVAQGKAKEAEMLLDEHSNGTAELRLRAYTPVLRLFIELGDLSSALKLFRKMQDIPTVRLDGDAFMHLIAGIAEKGRFQIGSEPIESAKELGYQNMSGPGLFDELVKEMTAVVYEIPETSAKRLYNGIASGFPDSGLSTSIQVLPFTDTLAGDNDIIANRVRINQFRGVCPRSGIKLQLIHLSDDEKKKLVDKVLILARNEQHKLTQHGNRYIQNSDDHLRNFYTWLDQREGRPFTILIDGANVGYYHQNFEDGRFSYHQVQFMVNFLERLGENPLIVLPKKYSHNSFNVSHGAPGYYPGSRQTLTREEMKIRDEWQRFGKVFFVPPGNLDDFYWIVSSVSSQTVSRRDKDLTVLQGNPKGQWPGTRPVLVTNDQMRDHQIDLLDPFLFRRWFSNYIVHYNFAAFVDGVCTHPEIGFTPADFFSKEIQSCKDQFGSTIWHFPIAGKDEEWFCCRLPAKPSLRIKLKPDE